jgi:glycerol-3-phosphate dehydrogenase
MRRISPPIGEDYDLVVIGAGISGLAVFLPGAGG